MNTNVLKVSNTITLFSKVNLNNLEQNDTQERISKEKSTSF